MKYLNNHVKDIINFGNKLKYESYNINFKFTFDVVHPRLNHKMILAWAG